MRAGNPPDLKSGGMTEKAGNQRKEKKTRKTLNSAWQWQIPVRIVAPSPVNRAAFHNLTN
jgi:hypothetical protein